MENQSTLLSFLEEDIVFEENDGFVEIFRQTLGIDVTRSAEYLSIPPLFNYADFGFQTKSA